MEQHLTGTTTSGFEFSINQDIMVDYEFLELLSTLESNPLVVPNVLKKVLGDEQTQRLKEHVRDEKGLVSVVNIQNEIADIFSSVNALKK